MKRFQIGVILLSLVTLCNGMDISKSSTPAITHSRDSWKNRAPQLRSRNNAQLNNCGYITVGVNMYVPFDHFADKIITELKLDGEKPSPDSYVLELFTFSVPITNELISHMPKSSGLRREAKYLRPDEKQMLVDHVKEITTALVIQHQRELIQGLELQYVETHGSYARAFFYEPDADELAINQTHYFERGINALRAELEKHYRWGTNLQDGIWFDFKDARAMRPSVQFLVPHTSSPSFLQRVANQLKSKSNRNSGADSSARASGNEGPSSLSQSSKSVMLEKGSNGDAIRPLASSHRVSGSEAEVCNNRLTPKLSRPLSHSPGKSPNLSPSSSPREEADLKKIYQWPQRVRPIRMILTQPKLDIQIKVVDRVSGKC